jgi:hypothetical protein
VEHVSEEECRDSLVWLLLLEEIMLLHLNAIGQG